MFLRPYKIDGGGINYPQLFTIPSSERLPAMAQRNYGEIAVIVTAAITGAFKNMNIMRSMNEMQIVDLAEEIIDSSCDDNLSLEDLLLFLQKLTRGEYGELYNNMDAVKFMNYFEKYREARFRAKRDVNDEQAAQHSAIPVDARLSDDEDKSKFREALKDYLRKTASK